MKCMKPNLKVKPVCEAQEFVKPLSSMGIGEAYIFS